MHSLSFFLLHQHWQDSNCCNKVLVSIYFTCLVNLWHGQALTADQRALTQLAFMEPIRRAGHCAGDTEMATESLPFFSEGSELRILLNFYGSLGNEPI